MKDILQKIAADKRDFVAQRKYWQPTAELRAVARDAPPPADFLKALQQPGISLIAELKKASPSKGIIRAQFDPGRIAAIYAENGARALSVLTDEAYFQGSDADLTIARQATGLPTLRKDFTIDEYQLYEARCLGADAALLIVALMDGSQLEELLGLGEELGLSLLTEVHTEAELQQALQAGARLVGINNRDLKSFQTNLETTFALLERIPPGAGIITVSESGITCREQVERLEASGIDAMLVGEALMREVDIGAKVKELLSA